MLSYRSWAAGGNLGEACVGRNILLITTDQQRFDAYGVNGGTVASTPAADRLAAQSINY